jgi:hypothetical protein
MRKIAPIILLLALVSCGQADIPAAPPPAAATVVAQPTSQPTAQPPTAAPPTPGASTPQPEMPTTAPAAQAPEALVRTGQQLLAEHLGVSADTLKLQSATAQEWRDGSLGCPQPGMVYPQVITPGFLLIFADGARTYEVHTAENERQIVVCENKQPPDTPPTSQPAGGAPRPQPTTPAPQLDAASKLMFDKAQAALAQDLGIKAGDITLVSLEPIVWRDSSLGCPQPGMNYMQVLISGYKIVLEAQSKRYNYHTDQRTRVVRCDEA